MAYPILGVPRPQFFDSNGDPLASGTLTITGTDDSAIEVFSSKANADTRTSGSTAAITLGSDGRPPSDIWGVVGPGYKVVLKDSSATTIYTITNIFVPSNIDDFSKVKKSDTSLTSFNAVEDSDLDNIYLEPDTYYKISGYLLVSASAADKDFQVALEPGGLPQDSEWTYISVDSGNAGSVDEGFLVAANNVATELVTNGDFATDSNWTKGTGWTISGGTATHAAGTLSTLYQSVGIFPNQLDKYFSVTFDVTGMTAGTVTPSFGNVFGTAVTSDATNINEIIRASGDDDLVMFTASSDFDGSVDNVSVKASTPVVDIDGTGNVGIIINGFILTNATNAGRARIESSQKTSSGTTTFKKGSWLRIEPLFTTGS